MRNKREQALAWSEERSNFNYHQLTHRTKCVPKSLFDLNGRATPSFDRECIAITQVKSRPSSGGQQKCGIFHCTFAVSVVMYVLLSRRQYTNDCVHKHVTPPPTKHTQTLDTQGISSSVLLELRLQYQFNQYSHKAKLMPWTAKHQELTRGLCVSAAHTHTQKTKNICWFTFALIIVWLQGKKCWF